MALKAGRVGVNPNYVDKEGRPLYDNSYLKELLRKEGIITLFTKEGNPISIDNAVAGRVYDLAVTMSPKQAGTGTPSPDNVREITGFDTLKITSNSVDTDYNFDSTVYGGILDVSTGVLTIVYIKYTVNDSTGVQALSALTDNTRVIINLTDAPNVAKTSESLSNYLPYYANYTADEPHFYIDGNGRLVGFFPGAMTGEEWIAYVGEHPLDVCYELATPTTVQLTPAQIALVTGSNSVSSTTGTIMDLQYLGTLVPGGSNGISLNRSLNLNREVIDREERKEIQEEIKEEIKEEVPVEEPVTVKKSTKKSTK